MLDKKMLKTLGTLEKDLDLYIKIHKKKLRLNAYKIVIRFINEEVDKLNDSKEQITLIKDKLSIIFSKLRHYSKSTSAIVYEKNIKQKRKFNNKNIFFVQKEASVKNTNLDKLFLHEVNLFNTSMFSIVEKLIKEIRKIYPEGMLKKEDDHYFIESPLNFWAVWSRVKNRAIQISIYGIPADYDTNLSLTLYDRSYSTFYISNERELSEGILLIRQALERKEEFGLKRGIFEK